MIFTWGLLVSKPAILNASQVLPPGVPGRPEPVMRAVNARNIVALRAACMESVLEVIPCQSDNSLL